MGQFLGVLIGDGNRELAATFGTMAFSTFIFDTIDVATRLGRYILQELLRVTSWLSAVVATAITAGIPAIILITSGPVKAGDKPTYMLFWTLFGTANQLLAALTLMGITVWLKRNGKRYWFTLAPMLFVLTITLWSLCIQIQYALARPLGISATTMNAFVGAALFALAAYLGASSLRAARAP
jgi:carbon starvation protein